MDWDRLERLLPAVQKPGRYVGGEYNSVVKDWAQVPTRVCLVFPELYDLGMSNLGLAILYKALNDLPGVLAERAFTPWPDMSAALRAAGLPLYSLETHHALADFDMLGFTLAYEQLYTNLLETLDLAGLPLRASERDERHPLVVAGGHATFNPEPMADFVDAFFIGEGDEAIVELVHACEAARGRPREEQLRALARVPGVYVPRLYAVRYHADGTLAEICPQAPEAALPVPRRIVATLPPPPTRLIVPNVDVTHNRATVEIMRGCYRGCRFCHAGFVTRPVRERPLEEVLAAIDAIEAATGFEEIGLLSLSSSDYRRVAELVQAITVRSGEARLSVSLPSLRIDSFSVELAQALEGGRHSSFTFAPEAASEALRGTINKPIATQELLDVAAEVFRRGWRTIKLYVMIGLPGETDDDVRAVADLARAVRATGRRVHGRAAQVNVSAGTFVPKPHTPFQWAGLAPLDVVRARQALLREALRGGGGIKLSWNDPQQSRLEAALSRGDRRLGAVIERAWRLGTRFDGWDEHLRLDAWWQAFAEQGLDPDFYAHRQPAVDETLPWDHIAPGVSRRYLAREWERSLAGQTTPNCRQRCHACGVMGAWSEEWTENWVCPSPHGEVQQNVETNLTTKEDTHERPTG